ncbi:MAG: tetratricopeptide repeat protein [Bdellovibrionales bacterium]
MNQRDDQGLIYEIEEDLQRQKLTQFWKQYGAFIIVATLALILGTASSSGWRSYKSNQNQAASNALISITEDVKKDEKIAAFEEFVKTHNGTTQAVLARFMAAKTAADQGKRERAIAFYDALANDKDVEPVFRGLADVFSIMAQFDSSDAAQLEARLAPLAKTGPWQDLAQELMGHLALKEGKKEEAKKIFENLLSKKDVSQGVQRRAADIYQWLKEEK